MNRYDSEGEAARQASEAWLQPVGGEPVTLTAAQADSIARAVEETIKTLRRFEQAKVRGDREAVRAALISLGSAWAYLKPRGGAR